MNLCHERRKRNWLGLGYLLAMVILFSLWYMRNKSNYLEAWDTLLQTDNQLNTQVSLDSFYEA